MSGDLPLGRGTYETTTYGADVVHISLDAETWPYRVSQRYGDLLVIRRFAFRGNAEVAYRAAVRSAERVVTAIRTDQGV